MKYLSLLIVLPIIFLTNCNSPSTTQTDPPSTTWKSLFNGKNLDGWIPRVHGYEAGENLNNTFRVENGILKISYDQYENYGQKYGALYSSGSFTDYRLLVEYRFVGDTAKGAPSWGFRDSGIQYHCQSAASMPIDQPFPVCLEYNLHGGNGTDERPVGQICTIGTKVDINGKANASFCTPATVKRTFHGDQWVTAEIEVNGDSISHWVNGEKILAFSSPRYDPQHEFGKNFVKEGENKLSSGHISLQSNSHPIEFRRIEIMEY